MMHTIRSGHVFGPAETQRQSPSDRYVSMRRAAWIRCGALCAALLLLAVACAPGGQPSPTAAPAAKPTEAPKPAASPAASPVASPAVAASPSPAAVPSPVAAASPSPSPAAAGLPTIPAPVPVTLDAATSAYLVLDLTSVVCTPRRSCVASLPAAASLLKKARDAKALVVYSDTPTQGSTILPEVAPQADEPKVSGRADKFFGTNLDETLKQKGTKTAVIVGTAANGAPLYTAFGANLRGYTVVVAEDALSTDDAFAMLLARYQLLNQPGFDNPQNNPLTENRVTLSRTDLITFR